MRYLLLLLLSFSAYASHCPPGALSVTDPVLGHFCSSTPNFGCETGYRRVCIGGAEDTARCYCEPPSCEIRISYPPDKPSQAVAVVSGTCDEAGAELAIAASLAKKLGLQ